MLTAITEAHPRASATRSRFGGGVSSTQSSQHSANAMHRGKLNRAGGRALPAFSQSNGRETPKATTAAINPFTA
jgi:hypothetical protein